MIHFGVYMIRCKVSGSSYVGSTTVSFKHRWGLHRTRLDNGAGNINLRRDWKLFGSDQFEFSILEQVKDKSDVLSREQFWIDSLKPEYNVVKRAGNTIGYRHTAETKEQLRILHTGRKLTDAHKAKIGIGCKGHGSYIRSQSLVARLSAILKSKPLFAGRKHSEQTKKAMSLKRKGIKQSESHRANRSAAVTVWWAERKARMVQS